MDLYEFKHLDDPDLDERDDYLVEAGTGILLDDDNDWRTDVGSFQAPRKHYFEKEYKDDDGNTVELTVTSFTGNSGGQDSIRLDVQSDPADAETGEHVEELKDLLKEEEESYTS